MEGSSLSSSSSGSEHQCNPLNPLMCHFCMAVPTNPVATACGHLFCWPCLYKWLQIRFRPCPVCRTLLKWSKQYVIPISRDGAATSSDGSDDNSIDPSTPITATLKLADPFPTRNAVHCIHFMLLWTSFNRVEVVIEKLIHPCSAHEHLQKEQTFGFFRTRRLVPEHPAGSQGHREPGAKAAEAELCGESVSENWKSIKRESGERTTMAADIAGL